ncbi:MAG: ankyrin repeat domain-containing protein, partial [Synergistaceae bacterium]|nr:ankyrin repeat domain-containing protein [Synergistaceae bacterium]
MKKFLISLMLIVLSVSAAFGGTTEELLEIAGNPDTTPEQITKLINAGADVNDTTREYEYITALMLVSAHNNNPEVIKVLLNAGANVNDADRFDETALIYAEKNNSNPEIIKLLLEAGANVNAQNAFEKTAK